ncbi:hypothetical protein SAMN02982985_04746 [Rugamonas rubra]|uniref:Uncharacterized protein n=1 Tax=Rugamonas rubra TaxID=758825 RepID=A0A1I4SFY0_9BURK|nr:hypothetical protein SAMN02982985_04746 [Rugamonas rubra]
MHLGSKLGEFGVHASKLDVHFGKLNADSGKLSINSGKFSHNECFEGRKPSVNAGILGI